MPHLTYTDCLTIQVLLAEWYSHRWVARKLSRSNRTISMEIKKYSTNGTYNAKLARLQRQTRRKLINTLLHTRITPWSKLHAFVIEKIQEYWSPEQVAGVRRNDTWESLSPQTIYTFLHSHHKWMIEKYGRRKGRPYRYGRKPADFIYDRVSIHDRPSVEGLWHWEGDTIIGKNHKWAIVTFNEKKSWYLLAYPAKRKTAANVTQAAHHVFSSIPEKLRKTLTLDNWREFCEHYMLRWLLWFDTYFADPWRPDQRWANENLNGLLRQFYPKRTDLRKVEKEQLDYHVRLLNNRPRKRLWRLSPIQFLEKNYCVLLN
jgi:IS30 family transposase